MNNFKIGDFVRSDTDDIYIGVVVGDNEYGQFHVAWHDGDNTYGESHKSMYLHQIKPSDWTHHLYQAFTDIICP